MSDDDHQRNQPSNNFFESVVGPTALILAVISFGYAVYVFGWQMFQFLKTGQWPKVSVASELSAYGFAWATYPQDWIGLHSILDWIPLSLAACIVGFAVAMVFSAFD